mgnify:CR=1 FL=1
MSHIPARTRSGPSTGASAALGAAGVQVLHVHGAKNEVVVETTDGAPPYVALPFVDRMDLALAAADLPPIESGGRYVSDAGHFAREGIPTLLFGPGRGPGDMYRDEEHVPLVHLTRAYRVYEAFIEAWCC